MLPLYVRVADGNFSCSFLYVIIAVSMKLSDQTRCWCGIVLQYCSLNMFFSFIIKTRRKIQTLLHFMLQLHSLPADRAAFTVRLFAASKSKIMHFFKVAFYALKFMENVGNMWNSVPRLCLCCFLCCFLMIFLFVCFWCFLMCSDRMKMLKIYFYEQPRRCKVCLHIF